jgi:hypothetical protein
MALPPGTSIGAYDVTADGRRFVMIKDQRGRAYVRLLLDAGELLDRIAPVPGR